MNYEDIFQNDSVKNLLGSISSFVPGGEFIANVIQPGGFDDMAEKLGIGKLLGQTSREDFLKDGQKKIAILFQKMLPISESNAENQINEILYHLHFLEKHYTINLKNSSSSRSKSGNTQSLKDVQDTIKNFVSKLPNLGYKVTSNRSQNVTFLRNNTVIGWISQNDYQGKTTVLKVSKTSKSSVKQELDVKTLYTDQTIENKEETTTKDNNMLIYIGLAVVIFWKQIQKIINPRKRRTSW